jgi:dTMP kinase
MFFVFEGANGSGKSTALRAAGERLKASGHDVMVTREPGGSMTAETIRRILLDPDVSMDPHEQTLLFMAARRNHLRTVILPALEAGRIVLCDRFVASTLVYQTIRPEGGAPLSTGEVVSAHAQWCHDARPDMQFVLHIDADEAARRRAGRVAETDRFESDDREYELACIDRFAESGRILGFRQHDVDATRTPDQVVDSIMAVLDRAARDALWVPMVHQIGTDRGGFWTPDTDEHGSVWWSHEPSEAHRRASDMMRDDNGRMIRFAPRSLAIEALSRRVSTIEIDSAARRLAG